MGEQSMSVVHFYHYARLFDEVAMAQEVRRGKGQAQRPKNVDGPNDRIYCI
jgi:hypothetical protein